mmetsp:Transcript_9315/g.29637  ORF Transcript_9315/g.29637 Transcript_9315/m.29637 type:complete len:423 (+) Transcript_9315:416-1684(+)
MGRLLRGQRQERGHGVVGRDPAPLVALHAAGLRPLDDLDQSSEGLGGSLREARQGGRQVDGVVGSGPRVRIGVSEDPEHLGHEDRPRRLGLLFQVGDEVAPQVQSEDLVLGGANPTSYSLHALRQALQELRGRHEHQGADDLLVAPAQLLLAALLVVVVLVVVRESRRRGGGLVVHLELLSAPAPLKGLVHQCEDPGDHLCGLLGGENSEADALDALGDAVSRLAEHLRVGGRLQQGEGLLDACPEELAREGRRQAALLGTGTRRLDQQAPVLQHEATDLVAKVRGVVPRSEQRHQDGRSGLDPIEESALHLRHEGVEELRRLHHLLEPGSPDPHDLAVACRNGDVGGLVVICSGSLWSGLVLFLKFEGLEHPLEEVRQEGREVPLQALADALRGLLDVLPLHVVGLERRVHHGGERLPGVG